MEHWSCVGGMAATTTKKAVLAMKKEQRNFMSEDVELCNQRRTGEKSAFNTKLSRLSVR